MIKHNVAEFFFFFVWGGVLFVFVCRLADRDVGGLGETIKGAPGCGWWVVLWLRWLFHGK